MTGTNVMLLLDEHCHANMSSACKSLNNIVARCTVFGLHLYLPPYHVGFYWICNVGYICSSYSLLIKIGIQDVVVVLCSRRIKWLPYVELSTGLITQAYKLEVVIMPLVKSA